MRVVHVIESRLGENGAWQLWPLLVPFSVKGDAEAQAELLNSREPKPTRCWQAVREFRAVERPVGCGSCIAGAIGPVCGFHVAMANLGASVEAPRPLSATKPVVMSPKVRRSPRGGFSAESIARLRRHEGASE